MSTTSNRIPPSRSERRPSRSPWEWVLLLYFCLAQGWGRRTVPCAPAVLEIKSSAILTWNANIRWICSHCCAPGCWEMRRWNWKNSNWYIYTKHDWQLFSLLRMTLMVIESKHIQSEAHLSENFYREDIIHIYWKQPQAHTCALSHAHRDTHTQ